MQMCRDRGYIMGTEELDQDLESFKEQYGGRPQDNRGSMTILVFKNEDPNNRMMVFFPPGESVAVADLKMYHEKMELQKAQSGIVIVQKNISPPARKFTDILSTRPEKDKQVFMEVFM